MYNYTLCNNAYVNRSEYENTGTLVTELLKTYGSDPALLFWKVMMGASPKHSGASRTIPTDRTSEGIRELESISDKRDRVLCSSMLLIHTHKKYKTVFPPPIVVTCPDPAAGGLHITGRYSCTLSYECTSPPPPPPPPPPPTSLVLRPNASHESSILN